MLLENITLSTAVASTWLAFYILVYEATIGMNRKIGKLDVPGPSLNFDDASTAQWSGAQKRNIQTNRKFWEALECNSIKHRHKTIFWPGLSYFYKF